MLFNRQPTRRPLCVLDVRNAVIAFLVLVLLLQFYIMKLRLHKAQHTEDASEPAELVHTQHGTPFVQHDAALPRPGSATATPQPTPTPVAKGPTILPVDNSKRLNVLFWEAATLNFLYDFGTGLLQDGCPMTNCYFSTDRSTFGSSDAVIFHIPNWGSWPDSKPAGQKWVSLSLESELQYPRLADKEFMDHFDWTGGYKLNADIKHGYLPWPPQLMMRPVEPKIEKAPISWIGSNCHAVRNGRTEYIKELMTYVQVDSYGSCLNNKPRDTVGPFVPDKEKMVAQMAKYKFYLAFENSNTDDYVTEKVFHAWRAGTVPIYMGAANIKDFAPHPHSYIAVADFESVKELADYIIYLDSHPEEYEKYLEWKKTGPTQQFLDLQKTMKYSYRCKICLKLAGYNMDHSKW